jgi:hypothetical protein
MDANQFEGYKASADSINEKKAELLKNLNIQMSIAVNRSKCNELVGYWTPKGKCIGIVVTAVSVGELEQKFQQATSVYLTHLFGLKENGVLCVNKEKV